MGFTIEDTLTISSGRYRMKIVAGRNGWSNSISWIMMVEDMTILRNFAGKELAVTTGLGFMEEEDLLNLVRGLSARHASGLLINTGYYIKQIPDRVIEYCNQNDLPLLEVPWEIYIYDMIRDITLRLYEQAEADKQISGALVQAIEDPDAADRYRSALLPYFDVDGSFQIALIHTGRLDSMDTVERRHLEYRLEIYLENITHNGRFFYYSNYFVLVVNDVTKAELTMILDGFLKRMHSKMAEQNVQIGVGSAVTDVSRLQISFRRAESACRKAVDTGTEIVYFDEMDLDRLIYMIEDRKLIRELGYDMLDPVIRYDKEHDGEYTQTLELYLKENGSIQNVAQELFTHRNTVVYRMNNIRKLLNNPLESAEDRLKYYIACRIWDMDKTRTENVTENDLEAQE